ncbi:hypothetical protein ACJMK2_028349 [Sinanodonta woodiana]|uniref:Vitelline membrane outer layer protein 1 homolog n=1 Tax=Sinanodonta woodiana TaxID=1069815 RepID=A0ABD3X7B7_SINWO
MKTLQIILLLLFARMYVEAFIVQQGSREQDAVQALIVHNGEWWGTWHRPEFCPKGSFANGYSMKIEWDQNGGDDTSLNSIKLRCIFEDGSFAGEVASGQGPWGTWHSLHICPSIPGELNLLTSFVLKVEPDQGGGDDTGVSAIKFTCRSTSTGSKDIILNNGGDDGPFGYYGSWSESCHPGSFICGLRTKIENEQGNGDDTALDDIQFYCCNDWALSFK